MNAVDLTCFVLLIILIDIIVLHVYKRVLPAKCAPDAPASLKLTEDYSSISEPTDLDTIFIQPMRHNQVVQFLNLDEQLCTFPYR